jgi:hypothetical protein
MTADGVSLGGRAALVSRLRRLAADSRQATGAAERCDLCNVEIPDDHSHLLHVDERRIVCVCRPCYFLLAGQGAYLPTGSRTLRLDDFELPDELWHGLGIPIGLAFFFRSSASGGIAALYPSPAGATESELHLDAWDDLVAANPVLETLEADSEALIVNRLSEPSRYAIAPIDECYRLIGLIRARWQGLSGGGAVGEAVDEFFAELGQAGAR